MLQYAGRVDWVTYNDRMCHDRKLAVEKPAGSTKKNRAEEEWKDLLPELPDFLVETQILGHVRGTGRDFAVK